MKICLALLLLMFSSKSYCNADFIDFTVNPSKHGLELRLLDKTGKPIGSFPNLRKELAGEGKELLFAMNAGIFMQNQMPLGLYIENGKTYRKLNTRKHLYGNFYLQPNGVFLISDGEANIVETDSIDEFGKIHKIQFATQSGPVLLIGGKYNQSLRKYDKSKTIRNAVCVHNNHDVTFSISKQPISFSNLTFHLLNDLNCKSALYLDGGISGIFQSHQSQQETYSGYGPMLVVVKR